MQRNEGIKTELKKEMCEHQKNHGNVGSDFIVKESKTRAMRNENKSHIFELEEAEIAKVRDGSMS